MKKIFLLLICTIFGYANSQLVEQVNSKIKQIEKINKTTAYKPTNIAYDPFYNKSLIKKPKVQVVYQEKSNTYVKKIYTKPILSSIFNKKAFIGSKWYKKSGKIDDYRIVKINKDNVHLKNKNKSLILKLVSANRLLSVKGKIK